jgi:hypothetical protein
MWHRIWNDGWMMQHWGPGIWLMFMFAFGLVALVVMLLTHRHAGDDRR